MKKAMMAVSIAFSVAALALADAASSNSVSGCVEAAKAPGPMNMQEIQQRRLMRNEMFLKKQGGFVIRANSRVGKVAVIDTQKRVAADEIRKPVAELSELTKMNFVYETAEPGEPAKLLGDSRANFAVIVVDDANQPAVMIALEDNWAVVNVAKLSRNLKTDKAVEQFFLSRVRKEISRVIAILCGGSASQFPNNCMDVCKLEDLDMAVEGMPVDRVQCMVNFLKANGMSQEQRATYRHACEQGWAPAPTNDYQKAIWDKVHEMPTEPIKIKYQNPAQGK